MPPLEAGVTFDFGEEHPEPVPPSISTVITHMYVN